MPDLTKSLSSRTQFCLDGAWFTAIGGLSAAGFAALEQLLQAWYSTLAAVGLGVFILTAIHVVRRVVRRGDAELFRRGRQKVAVLSFAAMELGGLFGLLMGVHLPNASPLVPGIAVALGLPFFFFGVYETTEARSRLPTSTAGARSRFCAAAFVLVGGFSATTWVALGQLFQTRYSTVLALVIGISAIQVIQVTRWIIFRRRGAEWSNQARQSVPIACAGGLEVGGMVGLLTGISLPRVSPVVAGMAIGLGFVLICLLLACRSTGRPMGHPELRA